MAKKPTITSITSGYASTNTLNDNFTALRDAFDNTLSLDGSTPNSMTSDLNLNNNDILNASRILVGGVDYIATALSYKNDAETAKTAAEAAQAAAELAYDNFDDRYLGSKASDPTVDNDGNALLDGALYYDTINTVMKFYDTSTSTWYRTTPTTSDQANIDIVAGNTTNINTVAGISANVTTVAGISSDVTTVAADTTDIGTVATSISNINTAATNISNINTVAGISANVTTVAGNTSNINTVATDISNVNTVAGQTTNLQNVTDNLTAIQNAATNATNAATSASNAATSASNASTSETNAASSATSAAASAAAAAASADFFDDVYLGSKASDPATDNDGDALNAGDLYFNTTSNNLKVYSGSAWQDAAVDSSGFVQTTGDTLTGNLNFGDNVKSVYGAGSDLQIYHDGSHSYIDDAGTGDLRIRANNLLLKNASGEDYITATSNGSVSIAYDNATKLATTSTGIDVTGTVTADGLTVDGDASVITLNNTDTSLALGQTLGEIKFNQNDPSDQGVGTVASIEVENRGSIAGYGKFNFKTGSATSLLDRLSITEGGDISFYEDTGTTAKFFWDASLESVGIGTTSLTPTDGANIELSSATSSRIILDSTGTGGRKYTMASGTNGSLDFYDYDAAAYRMRIDSSGRVGIGTSSPNKQLHLKANSPVINLHSDNASSAQISFTNSGGVSEQGFIKYEHAGDYAGSMQFRTSGSERMRIDSSGQVGIGTTSPARGLHVNNNGESFIRITSSDTGNAGIEFGDQSDGVQGAIFQNSTDNSLRFSGYNNSERMRIDSSGRVGIGTSSPAAKLDVAETDTATYSSSAVQGDLIISRKNTSNTNNQTVGLRFDVTGWSGSTTGVAAISAIQPSNTSSADLVFQNRSGGGYAENMRIKSSGLIQTVSSITSDPTDTGAYFYNKSGVGPTLSGYQFSVRTGGTPSESMRLDASGNLLVGTTSDYGKVTVIEALSGGQISVATSTNNSTTKYGGVTGIHYTSAEERVALINIESNSSDSIARFGGGLSEYNTATQLRFFTAANNTTVTGTERMRIASDGDVLIGTTNSNLYQASAGSTADNGFVYGVNDFGTFSRYANDPLILNRTGTDGGILQLRKNGSTVGSIGNVGANIYIASQGGAKYLVYNSAFAPADNNSRDLGLSSQRFKDLYLSGGVYLGGTGAANKLDDYEEGTFTATLKGSTGEPATLITATYAKYTKVGDTVFIEISYENVNTTGYSGNISIDTLPFTSGTGRSVLNVAHYQTSSWGTTDIPIALIGGSTTTVSFLNYRSGTTWQTTTHSAGSGRYLWITGTYKV